MQYIVKKTGAKVCISELDVDEASERPTLFSDRKNLLSKNKNYDRRFFIPRGYAHLKELEDTMMYIILSNI